jgi:hypothetical protein
MSDQTPLPTRIAWFAPWRWFAHWRPWKRWALFIVVFVTGYVETPIIIHVMYRAGGMLSSPHVMRLLIAVEDVADVICYPLELAQYNFDNVAIFYSKQINYVDAWFYDD